VQAIQAHIQKTDAVGRWGGEEFGIILLNAPTDVASNVAHRIRKTLVEMPLRDNTGSNLPKPTVSQGIATFPDHVGDADRLVDLADATLYQAKNNGRDQVQMAESPHGKRL
jgi:diguanylate cyclase (GGDEF)-like protein